MVLAEWALAFSTLSYLALMGFAFRYLLLSRTMCAKAVWRARVLELSGITALLLVLSGAAFNNVMQEFSPRVEAAQWVTNIMILLVIPLLTSGGVVISLRTSLKNLQRRFRQ